VTLRSRITGDGMLMLEVEDDGVGMIEERHRVSTVNGETPPTTGIGMRNVRERLQVQYGDLATVEINSRPGRGTRITLLMPVLDATAEMRPLGVDVLEAATNLMEGVVSRVAGSTDSGRP